MTEKEKFTEWVKEEMKKGLLDMRVCWTKASATATEEELFAELNRAIASPDLPDSKVLGKFSPPN